LCTSDIFDNLHPFPSENQHFSTTPKFADGGEKNITPTISGGQHQFL
jgi:hypothetical protein